MNPFRQYMIDEYNFGYYPTSYFDGGHDLFIGGDERLWQYEPLLDAAGARAVADVDLTVSLEWLGSAQLGISVSIINNEFENYSPDTPPAPTGPTLNTTGSSNEFSCLGTDPNRQQIYYMWDWGNGDMSDWRGPYDYNVADVVSHAWSAPGFHDVKVKIKDTFDVESDWSDAGTIELWTCGDINDDNDINILDIVALINYKYKGATVPHPLESANVNSDGDVNILDIVALINYKYKGGNPPNCPTI